MSAQLLEPPTAATGTAPTQRLYGDALLGAVFGVLLGIIAALAAGRTTIDPLTAPQGFGVGEEDKAVGRETGYAPTGVGSSSWPENTSSGRPLWMPRWACLKRIHPRTISRDYRGMSTG